MVSSRHVVYSQIVYKPMFFDNYPQLIATCRSSNMYAASALLTCQQLKFLCNGGI